MHKAMNRDHLNSLIIQLASEKSNDAEDAQYEIEAEFGTVAMKSVLDVFPELEDFSRRCAIELISNVLDKDPDYTDKQEIEITLIPYLESNDEVTRTWVADLLAEIGTEVSIKPLLELLSSIKKNRTPPDWSEPTSVRRALRTLGAVERLSPFIVVNKMIKDTYISESWLVSDSEEVVRELAKQDQVIANFQIWAFRDNAYYWANANRNSTELDFQKEWQEIVSDSLAHALILLEKVKNKKNYRSTFDWVSLSDM